MTPNRYLFHLCPRHPEEASASKTLRIFRLIAGPICCRSASLHPVIAQKVWATFLRGDYDTAVFQAFKEVEVAVRTAGGFAAEDVGTALMRKAFDPTRGPLTDTSLPLSERESLAHLFAGAIGSCKNPHSHRTISIPDPAEAVEMIMMASHLLKIVDSRTAKP